MEPADDDSPPLTEQEVDEYLERLSSGEETPRFEWAPRLWPVGFKVAAIVVLLLAILGWILPLLI